MKFIERLQRWFSRIMSPRLSLSDPFVEHVYGETVSKLWVTSLKTSREFSDKKFLFKLRNSLFDFLVPMGYLTNRVPVRTGQMILLIGKCSSLYIANCPITRTCNWCFWNCIRYRSYIAWIWTRDIFRKMVIITQACFVHRVKLLL